MQAPPEVVVAGLRERLLELEVEALAAAVVRLGALKSGHRELERAGRADVVDILEASDLTARWPRLLAGLDRMLPKPFLQFRKPEGPPLVQVHKRLAGGVVIEIQTVAVCPKKSCRHRDGHALVAIQERMVLGEALPECGSLLNQVRLIPALRARQSGFQSSTIA